MANVERPAPPVARRVRAGTSRPGRTGLWRDRRTVRVRVQSLPGVGPGVHGPASLGSCLSLLWLIGLWQGFGIVAHTDSREDLEARAIFIDMVPGQAVRQ